MIATPTLECYIFLCVCVTVYMKGLKGILLAEVYERTQRAEKTILWQYKVGKTFYF